MITFTQFAGRLARGELKNQSSVEDTNLGEISPDYIDSILSLTNEGLVDLTTRFPLVKKQIDLVFVTDQHIYPLTQVAADATESYLDASDSQTEAFIGDDFIKVLDIFDSDGDRHSPSTDGHIMQPVYNSLRFTSDKMEDLGEKVRIRYQAKHPVIVKTDSITIPPNLMTALQLYVAAMYFTHMGGKDHSKTGDQYFGKYLGYIGDDDTRNTSSTSEIDLDTRFADRGFV